MIQTSLEFKKTWWIVIWYFVFDMHKTLYTYSFFALPGKVLYIEYFDKENIWKSYEMHSRRSPIIIFVRYSIKYVCTIIYTHCTFYESKKIFRYIVTETTFVYDMNLWLFMTRIYICNKIKYIELISQYDFVHRIKFIAAAWLLYSIFIILYSGILLSKYSDLLLVIIIYNNAKHAFIIYWTYFYPKGNTIFRATR